MIGNWSRNLEGSSKRWPNLWSIMLKLLSSTFLWYCLLCCNRRFQLLSLWRKSLSVTIQMKATEQYFPVVLFIMLCKVVLAVESLDELLKCDHSNESHWEVLSRDTDQYAAQGGYHWFCYLFFFFLKGTDSNQRHAKDNLLDFSQLLFGSWTDRFGQESVHGCLWEVW